MKGSSFFLTCPPSPDVVPTAPARVIGLVAYAGTGKTTFAEAWVKAHPNYMRGSIARPLKMAAKALASSLLSSNLDDGTVKAGPLGRGSVRDLLDCLGSTVDSRLGPDWLMQEWLKGHDTTGAWILDDIRTPGQALALRKAGGVIVFLDLREEQSSPALTTPNQWVSETRNKGLYDVILKVDDVRSAVEGLRLVLEADSTAKSVKCALKSHPAVKFSPYN